MKSNTDRIKTLIAALLLCFSALPAHSADRKTDAKPTPKAKLDAASQRFMAYDTDKNGFLTLAEFKAKGLDDLAFKAADIDGDGLVDPGEFIAYVKAEKEDGPTPDEVTTPLSAKPDKPGLRHLPPVDGGRP